MNSFMDENFLLDTETARHLFHDFAEKMPICDYHCHLSPKEIYENKQPTDISQLWLSGDHYKWRAMRSCGIEEKYCTGDVSANEKFLAFGKALQYCIGNPLYHWAHIELQKYFDIDTPLNAKTAREIFDAANKKIAEGDFRPRTLIEKSDVKYVCTTDDPIDDLEYHKLLKEDESFNCTVLPSFRPDKALNINAPDFAEYIAKLSEVCDMEINGVDDVITALLKRVEYFDSVGCKVSDQAFEYVPSITMDDLQIDSDKDIREIEKDIFDAIFFNGLSNKHLDSMDVDLYKTKVMKALGEKYYELGWTMEIHIGAIRNNNTRMFEKLGPDTGFDSVGDAEVAKDLSRFLDSLCKEDKLPKTILFNLNDKDNTVLSTMLGNFQGPEAESKIQFGPAWWFLDTMDGMTNQLKSLGNLGVLGKFVGMETDSRSFTSYGRHDYFRRILCRLLGRWVEDGWFENNDEILEEIICGISYNNAIKYFGLE